MLRKSGTVLAVRAVITLLAACQSTSGKTLGENIDDAGITTAVKAKPAGEKMTRIDVDTNRGGRRPERDGEDRRGQSVRGADRPSGQGVRDVVNNLRIQAA